MTYVGVYATGQLVLGQWYPSDHMMGGLTSKVLSLCFYAIAMQFV